jgi:hypothetical protein
LDSDDAHDHHRACVGSFFLFVEQLADRVWRLGAEVGGVQRDALFHFVDEEHDGQVWEAQRAPERFEELGVVRGSRELGDWLRVVKWLVWWEFGRLVVFGARWKSSGMR